MGGLAAKAFQIIEEGRKLPSSHQGANLTKRLKRLLAWGFYRNRLYRMLLGPKDWKNLQVGRARNAGEVHKWMYDRVTLGFLLNEMSFNKVYVRSALESGWSLWSMQNLDIGSDGEILHANSLYMEAVK